jgi:hypothetical protein
MQNIKSEQEVINLSKEKWRWMSERKLDSLASLFHEKAVFVHTTAILLNKIRLVAVVGGNEVTNPFMVTEVYVQQSSTWMLASLSFTRLLTT